MTEGSNNNNEGNKEGAIKKEHKDIDNLIKQLNQLNQKEGNSPSQNEVGNNEVGNNKEKNENYEGTIEIKEDIHIQDKNTRLLSKDNNKAPKNNKQNAVLEEVDELLKETEVKEKAAALQSNLKVFIEEINNTFGKDAIDEARENYRLELDNKQEEFNNKQDLDIKLRDKKLREISNIRNSAQSMLSALEQEENTNYTLKDFKNSHDLITYWKSELEELDQKLIDNIFLKDTSLKNTEVLDKEFTSVVTTVEQDIVTCYVKKFKQLQQELSQDDINENNVKKLQKQLEIMTPLYKKHIPLVIQKEINNQIIDKYIENIFKRYEKNEKQINNIKFMIEHIQIGTADYAGKQKTLNKELSRLQEENKLNNIKKYLSLTQKTFIFFKGITEVFKPKAVTADEIDKFTTQIKARAENKHHPLTHINDEDFKKSIADINSKVTAINKKLVMQYNNTIQYTTKKISATNITSTTPEAKKLKALNQIRLSHADTHTVKIIKKLYDPLQKNIFDKYHNNYTQLKEENAKDNPETITDLKKQNDSLYILLTKKNRLSINTTLVQDKSLEVTKKVGKNLWTGIKNMWKATQRTAEVTKKTAQYTAAGLKKGYSKAKEFYEKNDISGKIVDLKNKTQNTFTDIKDWVKEKINPTQEGYYDSELDKDGNLDDLKFNSDGYLTQDSGINENGKGKTNRQEKGFTKERVNTKHNNNIFAQNICNNLHTQKNTPQPPLQSTQYKKPPNNIKTVQR